MYVDFDFFSSQTETEYSLHGEYVDLFNDNYN